MTKTNKYPIKVVSNMTGLSLHIIRAWEKRYHVVDPERTATNRRLYNDDDVRRLRLLKTATEKGYSISSVADKSISELEELVGSTNNISTTSEENFTSTRQDEKPDKYYKKCIDAIMLFDSRRLEAALIEASLSLTQPVLIELIILPLVRQVGNLWREGKIRIMHEHMFTNIIKTYLSNLRNSYRPAANAPAIIVTTPVGQLHELGALVIALVAASEGWQVEYLGADLPAEEIAAAAIQKKAKAVLLSLVYPADDPFLYQELERIRKILPQNIEIIIGGRIAENYRSVLEKISARRINDIPEFRKHLEIIERNGSTHHYEINTV